MPVATLGRARALADARPPKLIDIQARTTSKPYDKQHVMVELHLSATNVGGVSSGLHVAVEGTALRLFSSSGGCLSAGVGMHQQICPIKFRPPSKQAAVLRTPSKSFVIEQRISLLFWAISQRGEGTIRISLTPRANPDGRAASPEIRLRAAS